MRGIYESTSLTLLFFCRTYKNSYSLRLIKLTSRAQTTGKLSFGPLHAGVLVVLVVAYGVYKKLIVSKIKLKKGKNLPDSEARDAMCLESPFILVLGDGVRCGAQDML